MEVIEEGEREEDVTWKQVEEAVATGASLEAFLPRECIARPLELHHEQAVKAFEGDNDQHMQAACPQPAARLPNTEQQAAPRLRQKSRWGVIGQLRAELSRSAAWAGVPAAQLAQLLPPELAAAARALCAADWTAVFAPAPRSRPALRDPPLPLHPRAPLPPGTAQWLALQRAVDSAALCTYILCDALPALSRVQVGAEQAEAEGSRRHLRQAVGRCFARMRLTELDPQQMHGLLHALPIDTGAPSGRSLANELRLRYFAATAVWI